MSNVSLPSASLNGLHFIPMKELKNVPFEPLLEIWLSQGKRSADLWKELEVSRQAMNNWKRDGIPPKMLPMAAAKVGLSVEDYLGRIGMAKKSTELVRSQIEMADLETITTQQMVELFKLLPKEDKEEVVLNVARRLGDLLIKRKMAGSEVKPVSDKKVEAAFKIENGKPPKSNK